MMTKTASYVLSTAALALALAGCKASAEATATTTTTATAAASAPTCPADECPDTPDWVPCQDCLGELTLNESDQWKVRVPVQRDPSNDTSWKVRGIECAGGLHSPFEPSDFESPPWLSVPKTFDKTHFEHILDTPAPENCNCLRLRLCHLEGGPEKWVCTDEANDSYTPWLQVQGTTPDDGCPADPEQKSWK